MDFWDSYGASFGNAKVMNESEIEKYVKQYQDYPINHLKVIRNTSGNHYSQTQRAAADKLLKQRNVLNLPH